jgi:hypothetical protein
MSAARNLTIIFSLSLCLLFAACGNSAANNASDNSTTANSVARPATVEDASLPPFSTKEPEKYQASIFFASRFDPEAANFVEQTYRVARDGANRRLDFEAGEQQYTKLQTADGKTYLLLPQKQVYAEMAVAGDVPNLPSEMSLGHLLHSKPVGATYERIGEEDLAGRKTVKYRVSFDAFRQAENARTTTFIWADETLGLPIKTEVSSVDDQGQPNGAKNIIELREIKTEVAPEVFAVPKDFRKISLPEAQQLLRK